MAQQTTVTQYGGLIEITQPSQGAILYNAKADPCFINAIDAAKVINLSFQNGGNYLIELNKGDTLVVAGVDVSAQTMAQIKTALGALFLNAAGGGGTNSKSTVLNTVADFAAFNTADIESVFVKDITRGGWFDLYAGADAVDNGMIFGDASARKWLRHTSGKVINAKWYGMRGITALDPYDSLAATNTALAYINSHADIFNELFFPPDNPPYFVGLPTVFGYYFTGTININKSIIISGQSTQKRPRTKFTFVNNISGISAKFLLGEDLIYPQIKGIEMIQDNTGGWHDTYHAIVTNAQLYMEDVSVTQWGANGLHISACATTPNGNNNNYGNSNFSHIKNCTFSNCTNGIFIEGCDANVIKIETIDVTGNRRWGVFDNGFLGNLYIQPHSGGNGAGQCVTYGGLCYSPIPDHDGYFQDTGAANINKRPDLNVGTYWQEIPNNGAPAWNAATQYYSGGAFCIKGANAWSNFVAPYTEIGQAPIYLNARSKVDGGDNGAGVVNGIFNNVVQGYDYHVGTLVVLKGRISTNLDPDPSTAVHFKNSAGVPLSGLFESDQNYVSVKYKNTAQEGQFYLQSNVFWTYLSGANAVGFKTNTINIPALPTYANRTAALAGGLVAGDMYVLPILTDNKVICFV